MFDWGTKNKGLRKRKSTIISIVSYRQEALAVVLAAAFIFLCFSFFSFNPHDNSLFYYLSSNTVATNWCGAVGAHVAGFFFYVLGSAAFLFLPILLFPVVIILARISFKSQWDRLVALSGLLFIAATLATIHGFDVSGWNPGGLIGYGLRRVCYAFLDKIGSLLVLYALFWVSIIVLLRLSLSSVLYAMGYGCWQGLRVVGTTFHKLITSIAWQLSCYGSAGESVRQFFTRKKQVSLPVKNFRQHETFAKQHFEEETFSASSSPSEGKKADDAFWQEIQVVEISRDVHLSPEQNEECWWEMMQKQFRKKKVYQTGACRKVLGKECLVMRNSIIKRNIFAMTNEVLSECFSLIGQPEEHVQTIKEGDISSKKHLIAYQLPDPAMFVVQQSQENKKELIEQECQKQAKKLEEKLFHFGVKGKITAIYPGPIITLFEYAPKIDTKISKIIALEDDLALALKATSIRIIAPIPGRSVVGFELANNVRENVYLPTILLSDVFCQADAALPLVLGVDITGKPVIEDLLTMPHLLVAGSTGSGKSVGLNAMLMSLLFKLSPQQLRLILIDPKRLEFAPYNDIPHLLVPLVTNPRHATKILKWVVTEMERRYEIMARVGVRSLLDYHQFFEQSQQEDLQEDLQPQNVPFIVIIIDELADLMMVAGKEIETYVTRIAQMARAAGIHMLLATQRPSVDVLTGLIKVNFPSRISYRVSSKIDSKTILDTFGAEKLLGNGDMLFRNPRLAGLQRIHGPYVTHQEIMRLTHHLRQQQQVDYVDLNEQLATSSLQEGLFDDELYDDVCEFIKMIDEISISLLQRKYRIGFNRSARIIEKLELDGLIAPAQGSKPRKVL